MGVVLFLLAVAMIVGGSAAVYSGSLIISIERGWAMLIAGSVCASAGAVLLGLSVVASRLRGIARRTEALGETMARIEMANWGPPPPLPAEFRAGAETEAAPTLPAFERPSPELAAAPEPAAVRTDPVVAPAPSVEPEIPTPPPVVPHELVRPVASGPEVEARPETPLNSEPALSPQDELLPGEATVVGSYSAGANAYLMFSDGSIQAETPEGRFRFESLDELKAYVAEGERTRPVSPPDPAPSATAEIAKA